MSRLPGGRVRFAKFDTKHPVSGSAVKSGKPLNGNKNGFQNQYTSLKNHNIIKQNNKLVKDNDGDAFGDRSGELKHYNVEYGPAAVSISNSL